MSVVVGAKVTGKVTGITNFGAFVDMGQGQTGLVHISEISDHFIKDIHDVLSVGDEVTVKVMTVQEGKVGLSIRKATDRPDQEQREGDSHSARPSNGGAPHGSAPHGARPQSGRPAGNGPRPGGFKPQRRDNGGNQHGSRQEEPEGGFDSLLSGFLKDSEQRLSTIRHNTEGKRGGRGGRRS